MEKKQNGRDRERGREREKKRKESKDWVEVIPVGIWREMFCGTFRCASGLPSAIFRRVIDFSWPRLTRSRFVPSSFRRLHLFPVVRTLHTRSIERADVQRPTSGLIREILVEMKRKREVCFFFINESQRTDRSVTYVWSVIDSFGFTNPVER